MHLVSTDAARDAFSTGLGHAEIHEVFGYIDHAGAFVHDDHAAGTHDRTGAGQRFIVDWHIEACGGQAAAGGSTGLHCLEVAALGDSASDLKDHLAQRNAHGDFDETVVLHAAGERKNFRAFAFFGAYAGVPLAAIANDGSNVSERFDVVDECRLAEQAFHGGIRRTRARHAALT